MTGSRLAAGTDSGDRSPRAGEVLGFLRDHRGAGRSDEQRGDRLYEAYVVLLICGLVGVYAYQLLPDQPLAPPDAARLVGAVRTWGPAGLLLGFVAGLRYSTWQGPVVLSEADVVFLLSSPIPRAEIVRGALLRGLATGSVLGALLGLFAFLILRAYLGVSSAAFFASCLAAPALLGLLTAALGWYVECSPSRTCDVLRYGFLAFPVAGVLSIGPVLLPAAGKVAVSSGPWGWTVAPIVVAAGGRAPLWGVSLLLLAASAAAAAAWALSLAGSVPVEELGRRARLRRGLSAAIYVMDYGGAADLGRDAARGLLGVRLLRARRPGRPKLAVPWRDALWALRDPGRLVWTEIIFGAAVLAVVARPADDPLVFGAVLLAYLAAARLVEPMKDEVGASDAARRLPYRYGDLLLLHGVLPVALLSFAGISACALGLLLGLASAVEMLPMMAVCPLAAVGLVTCAAVAAQRGAPPIDLLAMGDPGAAMLILWMTMGPILASITLGVPTLILLGALDGPGASYGLAGGACAFSLATTAVAILLLRERAFPE